MSTDSPALCVPEAEAKAGTQFAHTCGGNADLVWVLHGATDLKSQWPISARFAVDRIQICSSNARRRRRAQIEFHSYWKLGFARSSNSRACRSADGMIRVTSVPPPVAVIVDYGNELRLGFPIVAVFMSLVAIPLNE